MWQQVGLNIDVEVLEWGAILNRQRAGEYQVASFFSSGRFDPALSWERIVGEETRKVWDDPEAIALVEQLFEESDPAIRAALNDRIMALFLEQVPAIGLYSAPDAIALSQRVDGFEAWVGGTMRFWNVSLSE